MSSFLSSLFNRGTAVRESRQPETATSLAAARALALAGSGPDWWPYAALVTAELMAVHVAGAAAPAPAAPWRIGPDVRLWIISRDDARAALAGGQAVADLLEAATFPRPILLGRFTNGFVYLDIARAPGPLAVHGADPWAGRVRELLIAQLPDDRQVLAGAAGLSGAHWPVHVDEHGRISVLGATMAVAIKHPERLDLPMAPTREVVLRELTATPRRPAPLEDTVAVSRATAAAPKTAAPAIAPAAAIAAARSPAPPAKPEPAIRPLPAPARTPEPLPGTRPAAGPARRSEPAVGIRPLAKPAAAAHSDPPPTKRTAGPAAPHPAQRQLPPELYDAPAVSAQAPPQRPRPVPPTTPTPTPTPASAPAATPTPAATHVPSPLAPSPHPAAARRACRGMDPSAEKGPLPHASVGYRGRAG